MQNEIALGYIKQVRGRSMCNTDPKKTEAIFNMLEQMVRTRVWKKVRGMIDIGGFRLCGK